MKETILWTDWKILTVCVWKKKLGTQLCNLVKSLGDYFIRLHMGRYGENATGYR